MTVERFKYSEVNDEWDLQLDDDGDYVDYADYMKLEAENALSDKLITLLTAQVKQQKELIEMLKNE